MKQVFSETTQGKTVVRAATVRLQRAINAWLEAKQTYKLHAHRGNMAPEELNAEQMAWIKSWSEVQLAVSHCTPADICPLTPVERDYAQTALRSVVSGD